MNIMKTNMLLLDNKILKEDAENTATIAAPVPSPAQAQAGMNALMFQGMKNLMANPELAREVGVMNDESADNTNETTAKSQNAPSNIAFQGRTGHLHCPAPQPSRSSIEPFPNPLPCRFRSCSWSLNGSRAYRLPYLLPLPQSLRMLWHTTVWIPPD